VVCACVYKQFDVGCVLSAAVEFRSSVRLFILVVWLDSTVGSQPVDLVDTFVCFVCLVCYLFPSE
jgi:hypothetical protein